ncbi:hypothetical protein CROQUDRAFT_653725 [Cronartium quercuum f. sp. fusiforme G11]|uniref:Core domain-containing protein n=1 Tax=Cronartium quercuum f. sp. fusiforme G11 TaxID=708437 RepID=A0A9P6NSB0_9BASI|nr:hypothetical protein CROQUDRAFT_653725 [Cronartium quercuum f. sp. fusiforme G11]
MRPCLRPSRQQLCLLRDGFLTLHLSNGTPTYPSLFRHRFLQTDTESDRENLSGPSTLPIPPPSFITTPQLRTPARITKKKQVISLTPHAIRQLDQLLHPPISDSLPPRLVRIGVKQKGCAGMAYDLSYVSSPGKFDEVVTGQTESGKEVRVIIDSRALLTIIGSVMDYEESPLGSRFVFQNPNIKEQCGCGESFMV